MQTPEFMHIHTSYNFKMYSVSSPLQLVIGRITFPQILTVFVQINWCKFRQAISYLK